MSTQKLVTTQALNSLGEKVEMRICSEPTEAAAAIYDKLGYLFSMIFSIGNYNFIGLNYSYAFKHAKLHKIFGIFPPVII